MILLYDINKYLNQINEINWRQIQNSYSSNCVSPVYNYLDCVYLYMAVEWISSVL